MHTRTKPQRQNKGAHPGATMWPPFWLRLVHTWRTTEDCKDNYDSDYEDDSEDDYEDD